MSVLQRVLNMFQRGEKGVLVTVIDAGPTLCQWVGDHWIWYDGSAEPAASNRNQPAHRELSAALPFGSSASVMPGQAEAVTSIGALCQQARECGQFRQERVEMAGEWMDVMVEPILPLPRLLILGCGHVGQALARVADWTGWSVAAVDDRPDFADSRRFPAGVNVICGDFVHTISGLQLSEADYVAIVTRGHQSDRNCLEALTGKPAAYIGMIGSRRRVRGLMEELIKSGFDARWLRAVHSPIGLEIGAETPEEIAVSIIAEMIRVRRKGASRMTEEFIAEVLQVLRDQRVVAVATIVQTRGSTPRKAGTKMAICPDGRLIGTVGGGCSEGEVVSRARSVIDTRTPLLHRVSLAGDVAADEGMVCGGTMLVYIEAVGLDRT